MGRLYNRFQGRENKMKVIIVGGVAGGATAAARIRRLDEHAEIHLFSVISSHYYRD